MDEEPEEEEARHVLTIGTGDTSSECSDSDSE